MDDDIRFRCPGCGKGRKAKPTLMGKKAKCSCGQRLQIPSEITAEGAHPPGQEDVASQAESTTEGVNTEAGESPVGLAGWKQLLFFVAGVLIGGCVGAIIFSLLKDYNVNGKINLLIFVSIINIILLSATVISKYQACSWIEGLEIIGEWTLKVSVCVGYALVCVASVVMIFLLAASSGSGQRQGQSFSFLTTCIHCGTVADRSRAHFGRCPSCGAPL